MTTYKKLCRTWDKFTYFLSGFGFTLGVINIASGSNIDAASCFLVSIFAWMIANWQPAGWADNK